MWKNRFLNEAYLINYKNVNVPPIKMQHCIFTIQALNTYKKKDIHCWRLVLSTEARDHKCGMQSTVDAQCGKWL